MGEQSLGAEFSRRCASVGRDKVVQEMRIDVYLSLVRRVSQPSSSLFETGSDFRRDFDSFWRISGSGKTDVWRDVYYGLFSEVAAQNRPHVSFPDVLCELYLRLKAKDERTLVEPVFTSKMLATIDPALPIWDRVVEKTLREHGLLDLPQADGKPADERLALSVKGYRMLAHFLDGFLASEEGRSCVAAFEERVGPWPELTDMKKLDFVLWTLGKGD